ncbi:hypothetical protein [Streptomyces boncukensis]|uniref:Uncharacterized protein n=1 Tax=Streptomyces boncukensis TaxID=2711219 RepID=A0A6G4X8D1_9ACTN|nr:hypothetical protein [Streptomyces boncukensis]NGO73107.1 hypothetical protein [Streptomyces boncukensis]
MKLVDLAESGTVPVSPVREAAIRRAGGLPVDLGDGRVQLVRRLDDVVPAEAPAEQKHALEGASADGGGSAAAA